MSIEDRNCRPVADDEGGRSQHGVVEHGGQHPALDEAGGADELLFGCGKADHHALAGLSICHTASSRVARRMAA